jgi:hypothetical protein
MRKTVGRCEAGGGRCEVVFGVMAVKACLGGKVR